MADERSPFNGNPLDVSYPHALLIVLGIVLGVALLFAASTSSAAFGAYNPAWDGASDLRGAADTVGSDSEIVLNTSRYETVEANESAALVLSPDRPYTEREADRLRRFVEAGGTLVVAEDFGNRSNALLQNVGADARFDGVPVRDERYNYRSPAMPVARNVSGYPLLTGVDALTLNYGTTVNPGKATVIVGTSEFAYRDTNHNGELDDDETLGTYPVATVEEIGEGRVIVVSDPSLFINAMLDRPGNQQFVWNLLGAHQLTLLDYSHAERLPPLSLALVIIRKTPLLQVLFGLLGLAAVSAWGQGLFDSVRTHLSDHRERSRQDEDAINQEALTAYLHRQHPQWNEERARRVTKGVINHRDQTRGNE